MLNRKKKHAFGLVLIIILISMSTSFISAYYVSSDIAVNRFKVGREDTSIREEYYPPDAIDENTTIDKKVVVKNNGTIDVFVRIFAEMADSKMANVLTVDWNVRDWTRASDGYWYYKYPVSPGEETSALFTEITASAELDSFEMIIYEESIQAKGNRSAEEAFKS